MAGTVCAARVGSITTPHANVQASRLNVQKSQVAVRPSLVSSNTLRSAGLAVQSHRKPQTITCGLGDFVGGDLIGLDIGQWLNDIETHGSVGLYAPPEGGAELRYGSSLKYAGYHVMQVSARGLGDPEAYLLKTHGVRPPHLGKQAVARFFLPPEIDYRLSVLPPKYKGIVVWVGEAKVLARNELQFLALLPALRPNVKVVVEMGPSRKLYWKPMKDLVGLPATSPAAIAASATMTPAKELEVAQADKVSA